MGDAVSGAKSCDLARTLGQRSDGAVELMAHLAERRHARFDAFVSPPEPRRRVDRCVGQNLGHANTVSGGVLLNFDDFRGDLHGEHTVQDCTISQCIDAQSLNALLMHYPGMVETADEARDFLRRAVEKSGLKPHKLAQLAGVAASTITRPLNDPEFKFTPKPATLRKIADAAGLALPVGLIAGAQSAPTTAELPLIGPIQAGAWLALDESPQDEPAYFTSVADRRYPHARQWLREVRGDSMNAKGINPGDLAHIVDLAAAGINLNSGMVVEVTRTRDSGGLREVTLKEVELTDRGVALWPRSTNTRWTEPVVLDEGTSGDIEVQITGLLLQVIKRFL